MIIDSHVHLLGEGWHTQSVILGAVWVALSQIGKATGEYPDPSSTADTVLPGLWDPTAEKLIAAMDVAGIDRSCLFAEDWGLIAGEPKVSIMEKNRVIVAAAKRFPDRIIPFFTIDPRRPEALDTFQRGVEDWGMKGLKLHPSAGYFPHDPVTYPLYEKCVDYGIPLLLHSGPSPAPMKSRFAQPIHIDDVAADFPDLPIIMAHLGLQYWPEALMVAEFKPNVFLDISGWQASFVHQPQDFYHMLRTVVDKIGPWRVFFGSDGPYFNIFCPLDRWAAALTHLDLDSSSDVSFTPDEIEAIMGRAFARLLKLG